MELVWWYNLGGMGLQNKLEMSTIHEVKKKKAVEHTSPEFRGEVWAGSIKLGVVTQ